MAGMQDRDGNASVLLEASRRDFLRMLALVGGASAVTSFLSACGGSTSPTATATSGGTVPTTAAPTTAPTTASAATPATSAGSTVAPTQSASKPAASQVFRLWNTEPQHADPNTAASGNEVRVVMAMYDSLLNVMCKFL